MGAENSDSPPEPSAVTPIFKMADRHSIYDITFDTPKTALKGIPNNPKPYAKPVLVKAHELMPDYIRPSVHPLNQRESDDGMADDQG